jgi:hypothetical protein
MAGTKPQRSEIETYSYAAVETALAGIFGADPEVQRGAFRARLKHFQRLGLPGIEAGKGARISYSYEIAAQWLLGLLMAETGVDPTLIVKIIKSRWGYLGPLVKRATDPDAAENPWFLGLYPRLMSGSWAGGKSHPETLKWITMFRRYNRKLKVEREEISTALDRGGWFCARNLTEALVQLQAALQGHASPAMRGREGAAPPSIRRRRPVPEAPPAAGGVSEGPSLFRARR